MPVSGESGRRLPGVWPGWLVPGTLPLSSHPASRERGHGCCLGGKLLLGQHSASLSGLLLSVLSTSLTSPHNSLTFLTQACILYSAFLYSHLSIDFPSPASFQHCFLLLCNKSPTTGWLKTTHMYYLGDLVGKKWRGGFAGGSESATRVQVWLHSVTRRSARPEALAPKGGSVP